MAIETLKNMRKNRNSFLVWSLCYLWFISLYSIAWSMFLFLTIGETLWITGTDLINLFVLLSGLFLIPANIQMLNRIANHKTLDSKTTILCCPIWLYLIFVVVINLTGAALCARKIRRCRAHMDQLLTTGMRLYKTAPVYKNFVDNMQWTLKCCGVQSYKDWFSMDWFDQIRDYDWDLKALRNKKDDEAVNDSVPLSCCKSGSCYPHYLTELGAKSINEKGCAKVIYKIVIVIMSLHLIVFCSIALLEMAILYCSFNFTNDKKHMQFLSVNERYRDSSNSRSRHMTECTTTSEPTDFSDTSETDISVLEHSISEIKKSIDSVSKIYKKGNRSAQTGSPQPRYASPVCERPPSRTEYESPGGCCLPPKSRSRVSDNTNALPRCSDSRTEYESPSGCCLPPKSSGCCLPPKSSGCCLPPKSSGCCLPPKSSGCCLPPKSSGCCLPPKSSGCCLPPKSRTRVSENTNVLPRCSTPPEQHSKWKGGRQRPDADEYEKYSKSPSRPGRPWRLCEPCESQSQSPSQSPRRCSGSRSPVGSRGPSPCWSIHSRQQLQKPPEASTRPPVLEKKMPSKKSASTH